MEVHCLGEMFSPMGEGDGPWGKNCIMVFFISHHYLTYKTSLAQIGPILWKFTIWGKTFFPHGGKGVDHGEKLYHVLGFEDHHCNLRSQQ